LISETLLELTATREDDGLRLQAHHSAWATCLHGGQPAASQEHSSAGRRLYDPDHHRSHRLLFGGHDPGVCARMFLSLAEWVLGYAEQALASGTEGMVLAERLAHPLSLEDALLNFSLFHINRGEPELALQRLDAAQTLAVQSVRARRAGACAHEGGDPGPPGHARVPACPRSKTSGWRSFPAWAAPPRFIRSRRVVTQYYRTI
jgi:hypothetical protein